MTDWLWIPLTLWAAFAQTLRNAAQRHLTPIVGTLGATLVRFLYGLPFSALWFVGVYLVSGESMPAPGLDFFAWVLAGSVIQIAATALLLRVMEDRNFAMGVAYSKTEIIQVAVFGLVFLGDPITPMSAAAVLLATVGLLLISTQTSGASLSRMLKGWTQRTALLGLASGGCFALAAVSYRGAALALTDSGASMAAAFALVWAQALQTLILGGWLLARSPRVIAAVLGEWRTSFLAGFMGAAASVGWFTAFALAPVAHVRTLGLAELFFSYAISRRVFKERISVLELMGMVFLVCSLIAISVFK